MADAKREVKTYGVLKRRFNQGTRSLNGNLLRGVKGCFICAKYHRVNEKHKHEEVFAAIQRLKEKHGTSLLTVEDLKVLYEMGEDDCKDLEEQYEVQWEEEEQMDEGEEETSDMTYVAMEDMNYTERALSNVAYIHGSSSTPSE